MINLSLENVPNETASIAPSSKVRSLGVVQDADLSMTAHVSRICSSAQLHLHEINCIRDFLSQETCECLVHAFVTSRLDMRNALLYGIIEEQFGRLQRIQNFTAHLVTKTGLS